MTAAPEPVALRSSRLIAECAPQLGGRLSGLRRLGPQGERDVLTPLPAWGDVAWRWPKGGAYPLIPYSNRIRNAILMRDEGPLALKPHPDAAPHTLHGHAQLRPWRVLTQDTASASFGLDHDGDDDWPWPFAARQVVSVEDDELRLTLSLANTGDEMCPAGLGWHPYLACAPGSFVRCDARRRWRHDADYVATGETEPYRGPEGDTDYLSDWSVATLVHADGETGTLTADPAFGHLVLHRPASAAYVCVEPVTHVGDAFNLGVRGFKGTGAVDLAPGATLAGEIRMRFASAGAAP